MPTPDGRSSHPPQTNTAPSVQRRWSQTNRSTHTREHSRGNSANHQPARPTHGAEHSVPVATNSRDHQDDIRRAQLHDQHWNLSLANYRRESRALPDIRGELQRAQLHDQRWNAVASQATVVPTQSPVNEFSRTEPPQDVEATYAVDQEAQQHRTTHSTSGSVRYKSQENQSCSRTAREPGHLSSDFAPLRRRSACPNDEADKAESACLQMVLDVFPDMSIDHLLALVNAMIMNRTNMRVNAENIINQLLEAESYPKEQHVSSSDARTKTPKAETKAVQAHENVTPPSPGLVIHSVPGFAIDWPPQNPQNSPNGAKGELESVCSSPSQSGCLRAQSNPLQDLTSPSQDPWRESPIKSMPATSDSITRNIAHDHPSSAAAPPKRSLVASDLDDLVTNPTHNGWNKSPERATSPDHWPRNGSDPVQSHSSSDRPTSFLERLNAVNDSSGTSPQIHIAADCNGSHPGSNAFIRGSDLVDPFISTGIEATRARENSPACPHSVNIPSLSRGLRNDGRTDDAPSTPMPRHQRDIVNAQDMSPSAQVAERRSKRKPFNPANIEGGWEYVDAQEATYGGEVAAGSAASPWANSPRAFAQRPAPTQEVQGLVTPKRSDQRQRVRFESTVANAEHSPAVDASPEAEEDATPPLRHKKYQGTPERRKKKQWK